MFLPFVTAASDWGFLLLVVLDFGEELGAFEGGFSSWTISSTMCEVSSAKLRRNCSATEISSFLSALFFGRFLRSGSLAGISSTLLVSIPVTVLVAPPTPDAADDEEVDDEDDEDELEDELDDEVNPTLPFNSKLP